LYEEEILKSFAGKLNPRKFLPLRNCTQNHRISGITSWENNSYQNVVFRKISLFGFCFSEIDRVTWIFQTIKYTCKWGLLVGFDIDGWSRFFRLFKRSSCCLKA